MSAPAKPTAAQHLARLREVWWEFDVLTAEVRCPGCRHDLIAGAPIVARVRRAKGPKPYGGIAVGDVMCVPCGTRALVEHHRVLGDVAWRAEREAHQLATERARALAEEMLTYESPPEDAPRLSGLERIMHELVNPPGAKEAADAFFKPLVIPCKVSVAVQPGQAVYFESTITLEESLP